LDAGLALLAGLLEALDAGFPLEAGALVAFAVVALGFGFVAAFFGLGSPVTAFLAGAFFAVLAFLAAGFFAAVVLPFPVAFDFFAVDVYFFVVAVVAAGFDVAALAAFGLAAAVVEVLAFNGFLVVVAFLTVVDLALVAVGFLVAGLAFSLAASLFPFPASLTLPEGPLGRTNVPFSAPCAMALLSWLAAEAFITTWYLVSTNFLMVGRETPDRASSG